MVNDIREPNSRGKKAWRPKDPKARIIIRLTLWLCFAVWAVFTILLGVARAREFAFLSGTFFKSYVLTHWIGPVWIVYTTILVVWAVIRFCNNRFKTKTSAEVHPMYLTLQDVKELASSRYLRHHQWQFIWGLIGVLIAFLGVDFAILYYKIVWPGYLAAALFLGACTWLALSRSKYRKQTIKDWRDNDRPTNF